MNYFRARRLKLSIVAAALIFTFGAFFFGADTVQNVDAFADGPPPGFSGAPDENSCTACHSGPTTGGTFSIEAPGYFIPGRTYPIVVRHTSSDPTRLRWGFQLTALSGTAMAGSFATTNALTQVVGGSGRDYIEHTNSGTFAGQSGNAQWTFNWTAPATSNGNVTFYSAGNQADNDQSSSGDRIITTTFVSRPYLAPFDYDGDRKTDIGIFRPAPAEWWIRRSTDGQVFAAQFGATTDVIVPGDHTGDGKADLAFWRPANGFWFVLRSEDFSFYAFPFGAEGDIAAPSDYDGDGKMDAAVFRPTSLLWFVARSTGGTEIVQFGSAGDQPVPADYDGDGRSDIAIRRPNGPNGAEWWIRRSSGGVQAFIFGQSSDRTVNADYTGDGRADVAFWRPSTGAWFVLRSEDLSFYSVPFGGPADTPAPGDYDGDGRSDTAVFRSSETNWYINRSTAGVQIVQFGAAADQPIPNAYVK